MSSTTDKKDDVKASAAPVEQAPAIEAIEEDDDFEEFEQCHWDAPDEDAEDAHQWQVRYALALVLAMRESIGYHFSHLLIVVSFCLLCCVRFGSFRFIYGYRRTIGTMMISMMTLLKTLGRNCCKIQTKMIWRMINQLFGKQDWDKCNGNNAQRMDVLLMLDICCPSPITHRVAFRREYSIR